MKANYLEVVPFGARPAIADLTKQYGTISDREIWLVNRINVPEGARGNGFGSNLLRRICQDANEEGVVLEVHPTPSGGLNMTQLLRWYRRYGFEGHAGVPMIRMPGQWIPKPRTVEERTVPSCAGCGDEGPEARLEPLRMGNPTEGLTVIGWCCLDCAERFRRLILARYPGLRSEWRQRPAMDLVNRPSRTLGRDSGVAYKCHTEGCQRNRGDMVRVSQPNQNLICDLCRKPLDLVE